MGLIQKCAKREKKGEEKLSERTFVVIGHGENPRTDLVGMLDEFSAESLEHATLIAKANSRKGDYQRVRVEVVELNNLENFCWEEM